MYVCNRNKYNEFLADWVTLATLRQLSKVVKENIEQNPKIMAYNIDFTKTLLFVERVKIIDELEPQQKNHIYAIIDMVVANNRLKNTLTDALSTNFK